MFTRTPDGVYRSSLLAELPWLEHGFGSRQAENWPGDYVKVKQIHSDIVLTADGGSGVLGRADGIVTRAAGIWIGVRTADCVPLLLADTENRAAAAVHAGWRGTAANIAAKAVEKLSEEYGTRPANIVAAIGPCIGECCYRVGGEVAERFASLFHEKSELLHLDLVEANRRQLLHCGVPAGSIDASGLCTACEPGEFHSWRRDKEASGRMAAAVRIAPGSIRRR